MVVCNGRCLTTHLTGVQRYTSKVLKYFPGAEYKVVAPSAQNASGIKGHFWEQFILPGKLNKGDILWSPSNAGPIRVKNQVVTIHDVVALDHPEWFNKYFVKWYNVLFPLLTKNARHIITISDFSKERIMVNLNVPEHKISVIANGVDEEFFNPVTEDTLALPFKRYILALSSIEPRKNLKLLLSYWKNILNNIPEDIGLVIAGKKGFSRVFENVEMDENIGRVHFTDHVDDRFLPMLYKNAVFFIYLSDYEGFGLPPLEAMAAGCPVITSNLTSLPEVVGDSGIMVNPYDKQEVEKSIFNYIENESLRAKFSVLGQQRATKFRWKTASEKTWDLINNIS